MKTMWFVSGLGMFCCVAAMFVSFIPPSQIPIHNVFLFEGFLIGGLALFVLLPWLFAKKHYDEH
jgi:hypothetical protein